jgi:hypothetical protein
MPSIDIRRSHDKSMKQARASVERVAERISEKFDVECGWNGNSLEFERSGVSGEISLDKGETGGGQSWISAVGTEGTDRKRDSPLSGERVQLNRSTRSGREWLWLWHSATQHSL